jgi:receptor protein-tyrosine kinase
VGLALLRDLLDTSVKTSDDLAMATSAPVLGTIPFDASARPRPLVTTLEPHAPRVEAFRVLRTNLQFVEVDSAAKVFVVTSALPEEGKTSTSLNLAITLAQAGHRTLLVEADLRRPKAVAALGLDGAVGVTTVLLGRVAVEDAIQKHVDSELDVLASGATPPNPAELLQSNAMHDLLKHLRAEYDMVIVDAPPLLPVTDAAILATQADGTLMVARYGKTRREQLAQAVDRLAQVDAAPVGVVLNMTPGRGRAYDGDYGYGYGYAPSASQPAPQQDRRRGRRRS